MSEISADEKTKELEDLLNKFGAKEIKTKVK